MAEIKTKKNSASVTAFLNKVAEPQKKKDSFAILAMMREITGKSPVMWGTSIVGFDQYHYKSERSMQEGDWPMMGFSPRKQNLTLYIMAGFDRQEALLKKLGKHTCSVGCLYIKKLSDVHIPTLKKLMTGNYKTMKKRYPLTSG